jgi:hypothetical protein
VLATVRRDATPASLVDIERWHTYGVLSESSDDSSPEHSS